MYACWFKSCWRCLTLLLNEVVVYIHAHIYKCMYICVVVYVRGLPYWRCCFGEILLTLSAVVIFCRLCECLHSWLSGIFFLDFLIFFFAASCFCFLYKFACLSICWLLACLLCHVWHMTAWCVKVFIGYSVAANGAALPFRAWVERAYNNNDNNNKWEACSRTCYTLMLESIGSEQ